MMLEMILDSMTKSRRLSYDPAPWKPKMHLNIGILNAITRYITETSKSSNTTAGIPAAIFYSLIANFGSSVRDVPSATM